MHLCNLFYSPVCGIIHSDRMMTRINHRYNEFTRDEGGTLHQHNDRIREHMLFVLRGHC